VRSKQPAVTPSNKYSFLTNFKAASENTNLSEEDAESDEKEKKYPTLKHGKDSKEA